MDTYSHFLEMLQKHPRTWLITGVAGFIGSNLLETLLQHKQHVVGLDNFLTGHKANLEMVRRDLGEELWQHFTFIEGDIRDLATCHRACHGVDHVLHQAALGSVPRSIQDPILTNSCNINGFLNMLVAARDAKAKAFVYAASSSTYGDSPTLPKEEDVIGKPLSPYAVTKYVNELYADVFARTYGFGSIGLRYFNVFGRRQDPNGAYAAVVPQWFAALLQGADVFINGDGETSRDFCYIDNVIQINLLSAVALADGAHFANAAHTGFDHTGQSHVYNVALGERTSLNELFDLIRAHVAEHKADAMQAQAIYRDFRQGDVRHSLANIQRAQTRLGYTPKYNVRQGLALAAQWYIQHVAHTV